MHIIISSIFVLFGIFNACVEKKAYNPLTIFLELWGIICLLPGLHLFGLYKFDESAYLIVVIGVLGFTLGYLLFRYKNIRFTIGNISFTDPDKKELKETFYKICIILLFLFYFSLAARVSLAVSVGGFSYAEMRTIYLRGTDAEKQLMIYGSGLFQSLDYFIFRPMFYCAIAVTIARFFKYLKMNLQVVLMAFTVAFYVTINFGRVILFEIIASIIVCAFITGFSLTDEQKYRLKKIILKYVLPIVVLMLIVMSIISASRKTDYSNSTSALEELYAYFAIPLPLLRHWTLQIKESGDMTWGLMFVKGVANFVMIFLGKLGITFPLLNEASGIVNNTEIFIQLFPGHTYNAFVSLFYYFYVDFRLPGVFWGSLIYGGVFGGAFGRIVDRFKNISIYEMSVFLLLFQSLMKCFIRWEFIQTTYCISYVWLILWFRGMSQNDIMEEYKDDVKNEE